MSALEVPELEVWLDGRDDSFRVRVDQAAQVKWDLERAKRRWPPMDDAQALWSTFVAWAAATRGGLVEQGMPFEVFAEQIVKLDLVSVEPANPTEQEAGPD